MVRRTRDDAVATRARILDSAQQLMHQRGLHCVTLEDVARAIGMTRGAVYAHFRSRAALLGALLSCAEADFAARLAPLADGKRARPGALEPALAALLDGDAIARHVSLLVALLQHKCCTACELCPLRERVLTGIDRLRGACADLLPEPALAGLLLAHLWGLLSAHALQLTSAGLSGAAPALATLYLGAGVQHGASVRQDAPECIRDTP
ncbi:TetR family transcriptional regulator [Cupriavidus sp. WKF15]|uniref:TetR family transcriptional regulator n=1 Tax=Cupriavidus sp. WKF15 TaxID=3032282 RepID=UPI0023E09963|nr:TetR family transcriptional regulator [Cupriavidus sp. WKF15]WER49068.1 TetR family transcriptional regulator [Cupriavidus sp. WKF15]